MNEKYKLVSNAVKESFTNSTFSLSAYESLPKRVPLTKKKSVTKKLRTT